MYSVFGTAFLRKSVVVFTHADLLDSSDSAGMLSGGAHITGGLGGSQEDDEATAASSAAAVRKLTSDDRLAGFLQGASEEVNWKLSVGQEGNRHAWHLLVLISLVLCASSALKVVSFDADFYRCAHFPTFFPDLPLRCSRC